MSAGVSDGEGLAAVARGLDPDVPFQVAVVVVVQGKVVASHVEGARRPENMRRLAAHAEREAIFNYSSRGPSHTWRTG